MMNAMRIRYNKDTWLASSYLAEFFKMCGFIVYEERIKKEVLEVETEEEELDEIIIEAENAKLDKEFLKRTIMDNLYGIVNVDNFYPLIDAYVDFSIHQILLDLEYYGKYKDENLIKVLFKVVQYLEIYQQDDNPPVQFAIVYCKYKIDEWCKMKNYGLMYKIEDLVQEYNDGSVTANILQVLIYDLEPVYAFCKLFYCREILKNASSVVTKAFIYYQLAKSYEKYSENMEDSLICYRKSIKIFPNILVLYNFVNQLSKKEQRINKSDESVFKIKSQLNETSNEKIECLKQILELLKLKESEMPLNPKELKIKVSSIVYLMQEYFYYQKKYVEALRYASCLQQYYNQIDESKFFDILYLAEGVNKNKQITKEYLWSAMRKGYSILYYSAHYLGLEEQAISFMEKVLEFS